MASSKKIKQQEAQWAELCSRIQSATSAIPIGDFAEQSKRIAKARKDYAYFVSTYFPHFASKPTSKFQIDAANHVLSDDKFRGVFEWARGHAKSTHISLIEPMWILAQENHQPLVMVLVSKSQDSAKQLLSDLQAELLSNELYAADYGIGKGDGIWTDGKFSTSDGSMFIALGRGQSPRGIKKSGRRVNYIVIDDIDDDELSMNPGRVNRVTDWCLTALYGTMDAGRGRFVLVGNRIGKKTVLGDIAERPGFYHTVVNILDRKGDPSWKENFTKAEVEKIRVDIGERRFQKEYMNNPLNEGTVFEKKYIRYAPMLPLRKYRALVAYTDPSFKSSGKNDYKATMLVGITPSGEFHVVMAFADQTKVSEMVGWHYQIRNHVRDTPMRYYMESNFMQDLLLDEFKKVGNETGVQIPIIGDSRKKPDKFARIEALQPLFQRGEIIFNEDLKGSQGFEVLEEQLLLFEKGSKVHDDAPDALEGAIWILSNRTRVANAKYVVGERKSWRY